MKILFWTHFLMTGISDKLLSLLDAIHIVGMKNYYKFLPLLHFSADCQ